MPARRLSKPQQPRRPVQPVTATIRGGEARVLSGPEYERDQERRRQELNGRKNIQSISADDYIEQDVSWLNRPFFPFGYLVIVDGDPGQGKSLITTYVVANAASGNPVLPVGENEADGPIHCGMIGAEDDIEESVIGRLRAAGYVRNRHIWFLKLKKKKGKIELLTFPDGTDRVYEFIVINKLRLLVIDPVTAFIGEDIQTHNDASVRRALSPLVDIARKTGCCIILVRHLNKSGQMKAMYRGGGSIAFSGIARSGLITGVMPDGRFGLAQVKVNYAERFRKSLGYSVVSWEEDDSIPVIEWHDEEDVDADTLVGGPKAKKGPAESPSQDAVREVLEQLFETKSVWPQKEVIKNLEDAGCTTEHKTVDKVRSELGIIARPTHKLGGGFSAWEWVLRPTKQHARGKDSDEP